MQRLQSCSCHSPRKTKKLHSHMYTCSIDVSIMLDLNCAYTSCIYVKTRDCKKTLHTICWVYMSRARRIKNNSCLNLMAGTSCRKKQKFDWQMSPNGKKKIYMQFAGYVTCMERINNVSWLNLMAGTAHGKNRNLRSQLIMHAT